MKEIRVDATDQRNNSNHYRFSLAHEAAHFVLHADVFRALIPRSIRDWKEKLRSISDEDYGWIEWQANALAGLILVPSHHLKSLLEKAVSIVREEGINVDDEPIRDFIAKVVGESFGVSGDVIARRLVKDAV
jgi:Zn-dependent peptidase ImmA (M78 family)